MTDDAPDKVEEVVVKVRRRLGAPGWIIVISVGLVLLVAAALSLVRYGAITPQGRLFVEARANGLKIGRMGRLKIEGVGGDIWRDFTVRRLTVIDEKGVWLDAQDLRVQWRYAELFSYDEQAQTFSLEDPAA